MEKKPLVIGNWKMELSHHGEVELVRSMKDSLKNVGRGTDVVICPSFVSLPVIAQELKGTKRIALGAQNIFWEEKGAFTGQTSLAQVKPFISYSLVGHSETREFLRVSEEQVMHTAKRLLSHSIRPVICIGETAAERESDQVIEKIRRQIDTLNTILDRAELVRSVIAYEPIWAIGSGQLPTPEEVSEIILLIRKHIASRYDQQLAERVSILYGGSVKPDFVESYVGQSLADGVLVGGASTHSSQFVDIVKKVSAISV